MSFLADRIFCGEWVRDKRLRALGRHVQMLLLFLRSISDRYGRFEFDAKEVHRLLYASVEDNVSVRDVEAWLEILRLGGFIKSYVGVEGRRVGEIAQLFWRQKLNYGKSMFDPEPDEPGLPLEAGGPPRPPPTGREEKGSEVKVSRKRSPAPGAARTHTTTEKALAKDRLDELRSKWPWHDVPKSLRGAERYVRRERGDGAEVEYGWFNEFWMPREPKLRDLQALEGGPAVPEPKNFRMWFEARYEQQPGKPWAELSREQQAYYLKQMGSMAAEVDTRCQGMSTSGETSEVVA